MANDFIDACRFTAVSSGTGDFVFSAIVTGYQSPTSAGAINGATYKYRAENAALTEWEIGTGTYNSATGTFARTTVLFSSTGSKVSFTAAPQVAITFIGDDVGHSVLTNSAATVAVTSGTSKNIAQITLTPGTWIVSGGIKFNTNATVSLTQRGGSIGPTSATFNTAAGAYANEFTAAIVPGGGGNNQIAYSIPDQVITVTVNTTYFLVCLATFTASTLSVDASMVAVRVAA